jgi:DNA-binding NtrC family response regulator
MTPQSKTTRQEVPSTQADRGFRKRVLVFSPDADVARYLVVSLENELTIERCTDLEHFVKSIENARPDIVLLDLSAFSSDVEQQIDALKRLDPTTPVIVLRAYVSLPKAVSDAIVGLADIVFYKPVDVDMVSKSIEDLLKVS